MMQEEMTDKEVEVEVVEEQYYYFQLEIFGLMELDSLMLLEETEEMLDLEELYVQVQEVVEVVVPLFYNHQMLHLLVLHCLQQVELMVLPTLLLEHMEELGGKEDGE